MKKLAILVTFIVSITACGPVSYTAGIASSIAAVKVAEGIGEGVGNALAKTLNCMFTFNFLVPTLSLDMSESEINDLLAAMKRSKVTGPGNFWSRLPKDISGPLRVRILNKYESRASSQVGGRSLKFYETLFAKGMIWLRGQGLNGNILGFAEGTGGVHNTFYAIKIAVDTKAFGDSPVFQSIQFCN